MYASEKRWPTPKEIVEQHTLPSTSHSKVLQILSICRSRLTDLSREGTANSFDELMEIPGGEYGVSQFLYGALKKFFVKVTLSGAILGKYVKVILEGWSNVCKHTLQALERDPFQIYS